MKKIYFFLLISAVLLSVCSCAKDAEQPSGEAGTTVEGETSPIPSVLPTSPILPNPVPESPTPSDSAPDREETHSDIYVYNQLLELAGELSLNRAFSEGSAYYRINGNKINEFGNYEDGVCDDLQVTITKSEEPNGIDYITFSISGSELEFSGEAGDGINPVDDGVSLGVYNLDTNGTAVYILEYTSGSDINGNMEIYRYDGIGWENIMGFQMTMGAGFYDGKGKLYFMSFEEGDKWGYYIFIADVINSTVTRLNF
jgi:opacity protein-like surface antigen